MTTVRAQCILPYFTNLPSDVIVNTFHFDIGTEDFSTSATTIALRLQDFYADVYNTVTSARAAYVDWEGMQIKLFDLQDTPPRIPIIADGPFGSAGSNASTVPTEVACVLSFKAAPESGVRYQSLYNRIYLGGLPTSAMTSATTSDFPRFSTTFVGIVNTAAQNLLDANNGTIDWVQRGKGGLGQVNRPIVGGWTDDGPDTQRRRSVLAANRTDWAPL